MVVGSDGPVPACAPPRAGSARRGGEKLGADHDGGADAAAAMPLAAVCAFFGIRHERQVFELARIGFLTIAPGTHLLSYLVDPTKQPVALYAAWLDARIANKPADWRYADFDEVHRVRKLLRVGADVPLPPAVERLALEDMLAMRALNCAEITARLRPQAAELSDVLHRLRELAGRTCKSSAGRRGTWLDRDSFRTLLSPPLAATPHTCFDPIDHDARPAPREEILGRVALLGRFFDRASFSVLLQAGRARCPRTVMLHVRLAERIDSLFDRYDIDPGDPSAIGIVLRTYLEGRLDGDGPVATRADVVMRYIAACRWQRQLIRLSRGRMQACAAFAWTTPADDALLADCRLVVRQHRATGRERCAARAAPVKDDPERLLVGLDRRANQLACCGAGAADAEIMLRQTGRDFVDFDVVGPVLRLDGTISTEQQRISLRAWRERPLLRDLARDVSEQNYNSRKNLRSRISSIDAGLRTDSVYIEHRGTFLGDGTPGIEPFWVAILATAAPSFLTRLPPWLKEERRAVSEAWNLPGPQSTAPGLLTFGCADMGLFRAAAWRRRMVLPLIEFDHAMQYGYVAARQGIMTGARPHESLQLATAKSRVQIVDTPLGSLQAWKSWPKIAPHEPLSRAREMLHALDDESWGYVARLEQLTRRRCHDGALIPLCAPAPGVAWKLAPQRFLHSYAGRALTVSDASLFLRYLTGGLMDVRLHDLRRGTANRLKHAGAPLTTIARLLGHDPWIAEMYAVDTDTQRAATAAVAIADMDRRTALWTGGAHPPPLLKTAVAKGLT